MDWREKDALKMSYREEIQEIKKEKDRLNLLVVALEVYQKDIEKSLEELIKSD